MCIRDRHYRLRIIWPWNSVKINNFTDREIRWKITDWLENLRKRSGLYPTSHLLDRSKSCAYPVLRHTEHSTWRKSKKSWEIRNFLSSGSLYGWVEKRCVRCSILLKNGFIWCLKGNAMLCIKTGLVYAFCIYRACFFQRCGKLCESKVKIFTFKAL